MLKKFSYPDISKIITSIKKIINDLYIQYSCKNGFSVLIKEGTSDTATSSHPNHMKLILLQRQKRSKSFSSSKVELNKYLTTSFEFDELDTKFNLL